MNEENETEQPSLCSADFAGMDETKQKYQEYKHIVDDLGISLESVLTEEQNLKLYKFIATNRKSFAKDTSELGCANVEQKQHTINTGQAAPKCKRPYRVSPKIKQKIEK